MSTNCDKCGYRDNEVKSGSAISEKGKRIILKVEDKEDLSRDILKVRSTFAFHVDEDRFSHLSTRVKPVD